MKSHSQGMRRAVVWAAWLAILPAVWAEIVVRQPGEGGAGTGITVPPPSDGTSGRAAGPASDILEFVNNDKLHGTLVGIQPAGYGIRWKHESSPKEIEFAVSSIGQVTLSARATAARAADESAIVRLTNGDMLFGRIASMTGEKLTLDTGYAGRLDIRRYMIKAISPNSGKMSVIYEGPNSLAEWVFPQHDRARSSWRFKNGTLYAMQTYPIGRNIDNLPDTANIEVEMSWFRYPELYMAFYTDNLQNYYGNCYMLQLSGSSINMYRCTRGGEQVNLGNVDYRQFRTAQPGKRRLNILVDKERKTLALLVEGALVQQWTDSNDFGGKGKGILFCPQNQGNLRIHNIRITAWDGKIPQAGSVEGGQSKEDTVRFINGDKVSGALKSIEEGKAKMETAYATMDIPLERMVDVEMATDRAERARRYNEDVQAQFPESGSITIKLTTLEAGKITGFSENFGNIALPLHAFQALKFNLYRQPEEGDKAGAGGDEDEGAPADPFEE